MDPPLLKKPELMARRFDEESMKVDEENVEPGEVNPLPDEEQVVEKIHLHQSSGGTTPFSLTAMI